MSLSAKDQELYNDGMIILDTVGHENSAVAKKLQSTDAANVPDMAANALDRYLKVNPNHEVYGSLAMHTHTFKGSRTPADIDIVVSNPRKVATDVNRIMRRKGIKTNMVSNPEYNSFVVQVEKNNELVDAVDIHPMKGHRGKYDVFGQSLLPVQTDGINVQVAADQLLRKANSVMAKSKGKMGPVEHRALKDTTDFITTSRLLLDSKELEAKAELKRVAKGRKALQSWKKHARTLDGYNPDKTPIGKDPIPATHEKRFINFALKNPGVDIDNIRLTKKTVKQIKGNTQSLTAKPPIYPYAQNLRKVTNPYGKPTKR